MLLTSGLRIEVLGGELNRAGLDDGEGGSESDNTQHLSLDVDQGARDDDEEQEEDGQKGDFATFSVTFPPAKTLLNIPF